METNALVREWRMLTTPSGEIGVYVVAPKAGGRRPTIIMLQEIFGVNVGMRAKAELYAANGFSVALPDLFWRQESRLDLGYTPEDRKRGFGLMQAYDIAQGVEDVVAVAARLKSFSEFSTQISVIGFCLGGKLAVLAGERIKADAIISFYGVRLDQNLDIISRIEAPLQIHVGDADEHVPAATVEILRNHVAAQPNAQVFLYPGAGHGFFNPARTEVFAPDASETAFQRSLSCLSRVEFSR